MIYRVELSPRVSVQLNAFPEQARDALIERLAAIVEDPYDP